MNPIRRHEMIMEVMLNQKDVTVNELSDKLQVTGKTIREDLSKLEEQGLIMRVHGGAVLAQSDQFGILPLRNPLDKYSDEKTEIAQLALAHIAEDDIIALDGGSTTLEIARRLENIPLTVITNDVYIISELVQKDNIRLVVPGGYRVRNMLAGPEAVSYVQKLNIEKAFLSATAVHIEHGLSIYTGDFIDFKQALVSTARTVFAVCDHHKFGHTALRTFASLQEVDVLLTDSGLAAEAVSQFRNAGINIECG
ncbi:MULTISPECIES: DeoR/GlpR family DNA-binding transcription regulator [Paenibacillus]|uniref:DeoR family transcriptional regulator n=1 Tax=Paenibacillus helianthi TaxID=1349432 RepID=A0ABX3ET14_9BACL|nr:MULTISPECIES: DeoR/GlpR family DNA-binding transcription regulator [Paenibacillus]OKP70096.1 DeoR family transcriptional regulator [Paenibacillus sp. P3E]OKP88280.1 DeoR family transcriptional regulator [Paenibacillus helianthi]OKP88916.1 DeoR family transcriptional regulator [Paenibacillus sp. P32E]